MAQLLLLTAVIATFVLWLSTKARTALRRRLPRLLGYTGLGLFALLVATGRLHWIFGLILGAALLGRRLLVKVNNPAKGARPQTEGHCYLQAKNLAITIDPHSGCIDGTILDGRLQGRRLSGFALSELRVLHNSYLALDEEAAALLAAYLDQAHMGWRTNGAGQSAENPSYGPGGGRALSDSQAYAMLGLANGADRAQIVAAHRRLIQRLHPDRGGSGYLAARLNAAKAQLLRTQRPST
ncbi:MAG: molecular chaperone DnaJ [Nitrococcus mobilis]|nr:molecular chaperone DnaJ [Nitrococcus mobilis]